MQLVNILDSEDVQHKTPETAIGIDFGTTNSLVAIIQDQQIVVIPDESDKFMIPSVISYEDNQIKVGNEVTALQKITSVKRVIGKDLATVKHFSQFNFANNEEGNVALELNGKILEPIEVAAHILNHLRKITEKYLGHEVHHAVITVPAYFNDIERSAIKDAAKIIGLDVLRLINEPTAAALAYGLHNSEYDNEICLVYDLGGGTFDVSILRMNKGVFQVLATDGDVLLGGDDFDQAIANFIVSKISAPTNLLKALLPIAKNIKERLSSSQEVTEAFTIDNQQYTIKFTTTDFDSIISEYIKRTINIVRSTIRKADIEFSDINSVILVGGSTRIPAIQSTLKEIFDNDKVLCNIDPDQTVVHGAAIQAHSLTSASKSTVLIDVLPLSLGTEVMGGLMDVIIERNSPLPVSCSREFTTFCDGQTVMKINICQGEREMVKHNNSLGCFELSDITPLPAGKAKITVRFTVDVDGLLTVEAVEDGNHAIKKEIDINANHNLAQDKIDEIIANSFQYAQDDLLQRELVESKMKAQNTITAVEKSISIHSDEFTEKECQKLKELTNELLKTINNNSIEEINFMTESLEDFFQPLVRESINKNLTNKFMGQAISKYKSEDG